MLCGYLLSWPDSHFIIQLCLTAVCSPNVAELRDHAPQQLCWSMVLVVQVLLSTDSVIKMTQTCIKSILKAQVSSLRDGRIKKYTNKSSRENNRQNATLHSFSWKPCYLKIRCRVHFVHYYPYYSCLCTSWPCYPYLLVHFFCTCNIKPTFKNSPR